MKRSRNTPSHATRIILIGLLALLALLGPGAAGALASGGIGISDAHPASSPHAGRLHSQLRLTHRARPAHSAQASPGGPRQLFYSDFSDGLKGWGLGGVGDVVPKVASGAEGPYCEVTLEGTQGRSELIMGEEIHIVDGETVLYEFEEFIVPGFSYGSEALGWNLFTQFKSEGEGSPLLGLNLWDQDGEKGLWVEPEPDPNYFVAPMAEGVWHKIALQITGSSHEAGGWVLSLDGREVDRKSGRNTIVPGKSYAYIKNGLYRSGPTIDATSRLRVRDASLYEL